MLLAICWPLNWTLPGNRTAYLFFPLWLGYILVVDGLVLNPTGTSLWTRSRRGFILLFAASVPAWWLFEAINHRTANWEYLGSDAFSDFALELARSHPGCTVVCCDFSHPMLALATEKFARRRVADRCLAVEADGLRLPFADATFDAVSVAFGVRNFSDMDRGLREILRVLRPGGRLVVLEFSQPHAAILSWLYRGYLRRALPFLGDRISGRDGPYGYIARTIATFPDPPGLAGRMREAGFAAVGWIGLSGGIVAIHTAFKDSR